MYQNGDRNGSPPQAWRDPTGSHHHNASGFPGPAPEGGELTHSFSGASAKSAWRDWNRFKKRISERTWFLLLAGCGILTLFGLLLFGTAMRRQHVIRIDQGLETLTLSQQTPAAIAGITPNTPPDVVYQRLAEEMPEIAALIDELAKETVNAMLTNEAHRLRDAAAIEVQAGIQVYEDPVLDINFESCYTTRTAFDCALHRYAGDGLLQVAQGLQGDDIYLVVAGFLKVKAADMAFDPPPKVVVDKNLLFQALLNKRLGMYDMTGAMPGGQIPAVPLYEAPIGEGLGVSTVIEENPPPMVEGE